MISRITRCARTAAQTLRALPYLVLGCAAASAQTWVGTTGNYTDPTQWNSNPAYPNSSTASVFITNGTVSLPSTANLNSGDSLSVGTLTLGQYDTLNLNLNSQYVVYSGITGAGNVNVYAGSGKSVVYGATGNSSSLIIAGPSVSFTSSGGPLTVTLDSGDFNGQAYIQETPANPSSTMLNVGAGVTVQGTGTIGNGELAVSNAGTIAAGTASLSGGSLTLNGSGGVTNTGNLSAVNSATLQISTTVNNFGGNINANAGTVSVSSTIQGGTLNGTMLQTTGSATLDGSSQGALTLSSGSVYTGGFDTQTNVTGTIVNNGNIQLNGSANDNTSKLNIAGNTTFEGTGTLTLNGGNGSTAVVIQQVNSNNTLTNEETIQGYGEIGNGGLSVDNQGTIDANSAGRGLILNGTGGVLNAGGTLEATGGGALEIANTVNNAAGNIFSDGSTVSVAGTIQGGTLTGTGFQTGGADGGVLDGASHGALTLSSGAVYTGGLNTQTYVTGTIVNNGNIQLDGGSGYSTELDLAGNTTLQGTGTVTLDSGDFNGQAYIQEAPANSGSTMLNVGASVTVQGTGTIGNGELAVSNAGTIAAGTASLSGGSLTLNGSGGVTNTGNLSAVNSATLQISTTVNNFGGNINANAGTVSVSSTIQGGTLNGTMLQTTGSATLDGSSEGALTLSSGSVYTGGFDTQTNVTGTIVNNGNIQLNGSANDNTSKLNIAGNTTFEGTGTLTLNGGNGSTAVVIQQVNSNNTLTNEETIQGYGEIGNGGLSVDNQGTIDANSAGRGLILNGTGGVLNAGGTLEATGGGALEIANTVNNAAGNIFSDGSTVSVAGTIQGGTLTGTGFQTGGADGGVLDGASHGALTLSSGAVYTGGLNTQTYVTGTIVNNGNIQLDGGSGYSTELDLAGNTTLQGTGTVTLNSGNNSGQADIQQINANYTLTNQETIQGYGVIGNGGLTVLNGGSGTLAGNVSSQTLLDNASGGTTNNGTFLAENGGTLRVTSGLSQFNLGTLFGGAYVVNGTTSGPASALQLNLGSDSGGEIVNNAANITLNGPNAGTLLQDINGNDAINGVLASNQTAANLTVEGGYNFHTALGFINQGTITIGGSGSQIAVGPTGTGLYYQLSGSTDVQSGGTLNAGVVDIFGGTLQVDGTVDPASIDVTESGTLNATGTIIGNVLIGDGAYSNGGPGTDGTAILGDSMTEPGTLTIDGNYDQFPYGTLDDAIGSSGFGELQVNGDVTLGGYLDITDLNGFDPYYDEIFNLAGATGDISGSLTVVGFDASDWTILDFSPSSPIPGSDLPNWDGSPQADPYLVVLEFTGNQVQPPGPPIPEPSPWMDLTFMVALVVLAPILRRSRLLS